ncbi:hypothetical protein NM688_g6678 [Phlebia brevispora]|uniref:Uncharacterized protein n=1 Tax=Phlebia brevispora TaxID=194682 RepID=A0ACC1SDV3_9APHY|nr:hypothetical protein NM688_g6678 [Phlebia brevispora]
MGPAWSQSSHEEPVVPEAYMYATQQLAHMSPVERSNNLRVSNMRPILQLMAGPMLRYDTVDEEGVWHGAALIVTADAGSIYDPYPTLTYVWDPDRPVTAPPMSRVRLHTSTRSNGHNGHSYILAPHPADPLSNVLPAANEAPIPPGPHAMQDSVPGQEIYVYTEMRVSYRVNGGQELSFVVPGRNQNMRWAAYSCNGFSAGVNPDDFRGPGFQSGFDPVWTDLLQKHAEKPFHALVGGGDQLYCDAIVREPELQDWVIAKPAEKKKNYPLSQEMRFAIDRFYFNHYCQVFRSGAFARANSSIPMLNMLDDHDLIDGFGSYPDELMRSAVFGTIGSRGYFFFLLFQCFINSAWTSLLPLQATDAPAKVEVDGHDAARHPFRSIIIGAEGPFVHFPSHSFLTYMGPKVYMLLLDCRAERKKDQVCSQAEYDIVFQRLGRLPRGIDHLVVQLGIPIAYPRMVFLETALESKFNPLVALGKAGSMGLSGFVNKFNADAELLDDLNDHWTAKAHKRERNAFIERLQREVAIGKHMRVTFLSGDVHCAAVGLLKTYVKGKDQEVPPAMDFRYMLNIVTSAIVNTPPPNGVLTMVSTLSTKTHRTLHHLHTDETMVPIFVTDPKGGAPKSKYIMGKRNWCGVEWDPSSGDLVFDIQVEKQKGYGETVGYRIEAPPPRWA